MGTHRGRMAVVAIAVALSVVSAPGAVRWAGAQAGADVFHVGLSKDLRGQIAIGPIKHYTCKDPVGKVARKMWTGVAKQFTLQVTSNPGPCDELAALFGGTMVVTGWTVTVRDEAVPFGTQDNGKFTWTAGASQATGTLSGTWGCGTHRPPLKDAAGAALACERCRSANHVEGLLVGDVTAGPLKGATIRATYAGFATGLQVTPTGTSASGTLQLALDGVYVVKCP
jgi:hypothetical protein